jgi:hypothetical protein
MCSDPYTLHYDCDGCGRETCTDTHPSPGEPVTCAPCVDLADALNQAIADEPAGPYSWNGNAA